MLRHRTLVVGMTLPSNRFLCSSFDWRRDLQINWKHIRPLNGSQTEGFEEFASQLARRQAMPQGSKFTRKGKPDAGIECYWTLPAVSLAAG